MILTITVFVICWLLALCSVCIAIGMTSLPPKEWCDYGRTRCRALYRIALGLAVFAILFAGIQYKRGVW